MKWIIKMERKYGRYAIRNLSAYIIALYAAGYLMELLSPNILGWLTLEPAYILRGQVWRLVSWILIPPDSLDIFTIIMLYFYYSVGNTLEKTWGAFRYNLYIFSGVLFTVIGAFILYGILRMQYPSSVIPSVGSAFSTYYISMSILLAFTATYPDAEVLLYFFIPIKMKWLGIVYGIFIVINFINSGWSGKVVIIASLLNFIVFFLSTRNLKRYSPKEQKRRHDFKKATAPTRVKNGQVTRHKCAVCGRTELDGDNLEFRFCSKCDGNYEYCQDHLFTHEHIRRS
ncbi:hypothetical protein BRYFOR_06440 [Marvinbryantia formatexigens DSM 14469]|uniref:Peptidase S54 rhomboid domain-containing protein n=1 Tax=Marvinbryantia formatexigens DSM 14469 TaxID=478749 RepID=C6LCU2_9FIRM|nr:hypothetical protein [Marvinbryantia formatexigens]EET61756.1 hypothetical protein BRYFOR_06440 [Marvinbryantia formatexigens DSM 14469]UWO24434.1 rhomboid family intramembrane serine protease [Marvinbryantia formatexigens DSM 14469]SDF07483.1 hypothetical protein SAMN05660368_00020 [Marvinbryantia formatexigens]